MAGLEYAEIRSREDADSIYVHIESVYDGWFFNESQFDWAHFIDMLEDRSDESGRYYDLGEDMESPAIKRIREIVRELRRQSA